MQYIQSNELGHTYNKVTAMVIFFIVSHIIWLISYGPNHIPKYAKSIFLLTDTLQILALVLSFGCGVTFTKLDDRWKIFVFSCLGIWICAYIMLKILLACHPEPGKTTIISQKEIFGKISYGSNRFFRNKKILI